ncbi:MAG: sulfite exporter TauE/SafE family protein [Egibacteraceae bacterium]
MEWTLQWLLTLGMAGLVAQFVDGALGMGYGVTSSTLLLAAGLAPASVSASVHVSKIMTGLASGASHWRFGNLDWPTVRRIGLPGCLGGFVGAVALSNASGTAAKPWIAGILLLLGVYVLARFTLTRIAVPATTATLRKRFLVPVGLFGGFVDAIGGGGWGPVATPSLLASGRMEPRKVIGSVNASECLVALSVTAGFLVALGLEGVQPAVLVALLAGGLLAAPIAACVVRRVAPRPLGAAVGGLIILTNSRAVLDGLDASGSVRLGVVALIVCLWAAAVAHTVRQSRRDRPVDVPTPEPVPVSAHG